MYTLFADEKRIRKTFEHWL